MIDLFLLILKTSSNEVISLGVTKRKKQTSSLVLKQPFKDYLGPWVDLRETWIILTQGKLMDCPRPGLVPLFDSLTLNTTKYSDYLALHEAVMLRDSKAHLTSEVDFCKELHRLKKLHPSKL
jgi:hypothetical protein